MSGTGYDLSTSIYSQDGRIFQIEYAQKAIENSETVVGLVCADGVILAAEKIKRSPLQVQDSNKRIFNVEKHIGIAISGRLPDGMVVVERARKEAESYKDNFGLPISGQILTERIANFMHAHTLYGQFRPLGIEVLVASRDRGKNCLFKIENTGSFKGYHGVTAGKGNQIAKTHLEKADRTKNCQDNLKFVALAIAAAHEEFKEKTYEFQMSLLCEQNNFRHQFVDWETRDRLIKEAEEEIDVE